MRGALASAVLALAVYAATAAPAVTEIDSGELAAVAATLGIAHPSGYPLFSMLGRVWCLLPQPFATVRWMNLLSSLLASGAVLLLYRTVLELTTPPHRDRPGRSGHLGALAGALAFAFDATEWSVATVTEVHALQMFLDAAFLHAIVRARLWGGGALRGRALLAACYLGGLCLTNHLTSALLLPGFVLSAALRRRSIPARAALAGVSSALLGASVYLFLPIRSAQEPLLDWGSPDTWWSFWHHVSGAQYRVWMFTSREAFAANVRELLGLLRGGFAAILLLALVPGIARARRCRGFLAGTGAMFLLSVAYPLGYGIHDIEAYFLPAFLIAALWIGLGVAAVAEHAERASLAASRAGAGLALLPVLPLMVNWQGADRSRDRSIDATARCMLATPPSGSVILSAAWDLFVSPALYLQAVEGLRPDVVVLDQEHFRRGWNLPWIRRHRPRLLEGLQDEADHLQQLVVRFEHGEPYDPAEIQRAFETVLGGILEAAAGRGAAYVTPEVETGVAPPLRRVPEGLLLRVEALGRKPRLPPPVPWPKLPSPAEAPGLWASRAREYAARMAALSGYRALRSGMRGRARQDWARALAWDPANRPAREGIEALEAADGRDSLAPLREGW